MADAAQRPANRSYGWGPFTALGIAVTLITLIIDQTAKFWLLDVFDLAGRSHAPLTPYLDLVLTWNAGISYGLLQQHTALGLWALTGFKVLAVVFLWIWLARSSAKLTAVALGLIIGGAIGNAVDRFHWPGVMDFVLVHIDSGGFSFRWYVFNLADAAIVAGVVGLLYDSLRSAGAAKAP